MQPSVRSDGLGGGARVVVVAHHHERSAEHQLAGLTTRQLSCRILGIDDSERVAWIWHANRPRLVYRVDWVRAGRASEFGHAPNLVHGTAGAPRELQRLRGRKRLSANPTD